MPTLLLPFIILVLPPTDLLSQVSSRSGRQVTVLWGSLAPVSRRLTSAAFLIHPPPAPSGLVVAETEVKPQGWWKGVMFGLLVGRREEGGVGRRGIADGGGAFSLSSWLDGGSTY